MMAAITDFLSKIGLFLFLLLILVEGEFGAWSWLGLGLVCTFACVENAMSVILFTS